jgi:hypothetical protein
MNRLEQAENEQLVEFRFAKDWVNRRTEYKAGEIALLHKQDAFKIRKLEGGELVNDGQRTQVDAVDTSADTITTDAARSGATSTAGNRNTGKR